MKPLFTQGAIAAGLLWLAATQAAPVEETHAGRIRPYEKNPRYWQYQGKPVLLLGASDDDNLFQWTDERLVQHLDRLMEAGGNYVRNTMSDRDPANLRPFAHTGGKFDLDRWNEEYWARFATFLDLTRQRQIIVQIELWDVHDLHSRPWEGNAWNPANNVNYTHANTRLAPAYAKPRPRNPTEKPHDFFLSVPALNDDQLVLSRQRRYVDKLLDHTLGHGHVLYCISNEIHPQYPPEWGWYWAAHLRERAAIAGHRIEVSEMYWEPDLRAEQHRASLERDDLYSFFEGSQNSSTLDPEDHWRNLQFVRETLRPHPRPINHTKIYGADTGPFWAGDACNAQEKFWRNILGGSASSRFHRPEAGLGLSAAARVQVKSMRLFTDAMGVFATEPRNDLLSERESNEAYCMAEPGRTYAVYFPDGGAVKLDVSAAPGALQIRWLNIHRSEWQPARTAPGGTKLWLKPPGSGAWAVLVTK